MQTKPAKKPLSRFQRTVRSLLIISGIGVSLAAYNTYNSQSDIKTATGNQSDGQKAFFVAAAERPDIPVFYKNLRPEQRLQMARNIARYDDPKLPALVVKLLGDFDANARAELTKTLTTLAPKQPQATADQLKDKGGFQSLAVFQALKPLGADAIPYIVKTMPVADARPNAITYLVETGPASIPALLPLLNDENKDIRLAAADGLGKLKAKEASSKLRDLYTKAEIADRTAYLTALSGIGDPANHDIFYDLLTDEREPLPIRSQAALGLGRIGDRSSCTTLWVFTDSDERELATSAITGLQLAGDSALDAMVGRPAALPRVAAGISTPRASELLRELLVKEPNRAELFLAAKGKPDLVPDIVRAIRNRAANGEVLNAAIIALTSTDAGRKAAEQVASSQADFAAMLERRTG